MPRYRHNRTCPVCADLHDFDTDTAGPDSEPFGFYGIHQNVATMLGWLVRHDPQRPDGVVNDIIGQAESRLEIPRAAVIQCGSKASPHRAR